MGLRVTMTTVRFILSLYNNHDLMYMNWSQYWTMSMYGLIDKHKNKNFRKKVFTQLKARKLHSILNKLITASKHDYFCNITIATGNGYVMHTETRLPCGAYKSLSIPANFSTSER